MRNVALINNLNSSFYETDFKVLGSNSYTKQWIEKLNHGTLFLRVEIFVLFNF